MCIQIQLEANEFILSDEQSNIYVESVKRYLKINEFVRNKNGSARICLDSYKPLTKELSGSKTTLGQNIDSDNLHMYDCVSYFLACTFVIYGLLRVLRTVPGIYFEFSLLLAQLLSIIQSSITYGSVACS